MFDQQRGLASYFDQASDQPAKSWYEQTETAAGLHADIPHLEWWARHPEYKEQVWVPTGQTDVFAIPDGKTFHKRKDPGWKTTDWGGADHKSRTEMSNKPRQQRGNETYQQRQDRIKTEREERERIRKEKKAQLEAARNAMMTIMIRMGFKAAQPEDVIAMSNTAAFSERYLTLALAEKQRVIAHAEQQHAKGVQGGKRKRDIIVHEYKTELLFALQIEGRTSLAEQWPVIFDHMRKFCTKMDVPLIIDEQMPGNTQEKSQYICPVITFLRQIQKQIISYNIARVTKMDKERNKGDIQNITHYDQDDYHFINAFYTMNTLRKSLTRDSYPRKQPAYLPDATAQDSWNDKYRQLELAAFNKLHPGARAPKRLLPRWQYNKGHRNYRGRGYSAPVIYVNPDTGYVRYGGQGGSRGGYGRKGGSRGGYGGRRNGNQRKQTQYTYPQEHQHDEEESMSGAEEQGSEGSSSPPPAGRGRNVWVPGQEEDGQGYGSNQIPPPPPQLPRLVIPPVDDIPYDDKSMPDRGARPEGARRVLFDPPRTYSPRPAPYPPIKEKKVVHPAYQTDPTEPANIYNVRRL
jgi:hypothetical protein